MRASPATRRVVWLAHCLAVGTAPYALAADDPAEFDEIVVSASRIERSLKTTPRSISIISAEEIRASTATSVVDLIRREANVNLQSFFGSDKFATLDIRGMGATATSNVLVMVDGVRLNTDDLAGPDFSTISLSQIERVEIVRGGNSVRYGNGAVGGVINLITKRSMRATPQLDVQARRGAFDSDDYRLHAAAELGPLALSVDGADVDSDGYRDNEFIDKQTGAVRLDAFAFDDALELSLRASHHEDSYGLPGPLSLADFKGSARDRRRSDRPFDRGSTTDNRYVAQASWHSDRYGELSATGTYRDRENPYFIAFDPARRAADQANQIDIAARTVGVNYALPFTLLGESHQLALGVDWNKADYLRTENGSAVPGNSTRRSGHLQERGYFADLLLGATHGVTFNAGWRGHRFASAQSDRRLERLCQIVLQTTLVTIDTPFGPLVLPLELPVEQGCQTSFNLRDAARQRAYNDAFSVGATWEINPAVTAFVSANKSFRSPNVDELLFATTTLGPQAGRGVDAGVRLAPRPWLELSATAFHLRVEDEIFFSQDPVTGQSRNRNLQGETRRTGAELELRATPLDTLALRGTFGYVRPKLDTGADVPLVPRVTAGLGFDWTPLPAITLTFSTTHVGARADGNDLGPEAFPRLPAYTFCDASLRYRVGRVEVFGGVNNLSDAHYSTIAYSSTLYPMAERNAFAGVRVEL